MSLSLADGLSVTLISTVGFWAVPDEVGVAAEAPCAGGIVASGARIPSNIVRTVSSLTVLWACAIDLRYERFKSFNVIGLLNLPCNLSITLPIDQKAECRRAAHPRSSEHEAPRNMEPRLLVPVSTALLG